MMILTVAFDSLASLLSEKLLCTGAQFQHIGPPIQWRRPMALRRMSCF